MITRLLVTLLSAGLLWLLPLAQVQAAHVTGIVQAAGTGEPLADVVIQAGVTGDQGTNRVGSTNNSGVYFLDLEPGEYNLVVKKTDWENAEALIQVSEGIGQTRNFLMNPADGQQTISVGIQMICSISGISIEGGEVLVSRWSGMEAGGDPDQSWVRTTDAFGRINVGPVETGSYLFRFSKPGWETATWPEDGPVFLGSTHQGVAAMAPVGHELPVVVTGWNPITQAAGPLSGVQVELEGWDLRQERLVVPVRSAVTDSTGTVVFRSLPSIKWRLSGKKLGYNTAESWAGPDGTGGFAQVSMNLNIQQDTGIRIVLDSPYQTGYILSGTQVLLEGMEGTSTEGIRRVLTATKAISGETVSVQADKLLPGRYLIETQLNKEINSQTSQLFVNKNGVIPTQFDFRVMSLPYQTIVEIAPRQELLLQVFLQPIPARVTGRLLAVDELLPYKTGTGDDRVFRPISAESMEFISTDAFNLLKEEYKTTWVATDENGWFQMDLIPSLYGIRIPELSDYFGYQVGFQESRSEGGEWVEKSGIIGWPYPDEYPYHNWDPEMISGWKAFSSLGSSSLDLYVHRHFINLTGGASLGSDSYRNAIIHAQSNNLNQTFTWPEAVLDLASVALDGPENLTSGLHVIGSGAYYLGFEFQYVTPGTWLLHGINPDYNLAPPVGAQGVTVEIASWSAPGFLPEVDPTDETFFIPGKSHQLNRSGSSPLFVATNTMPVGPLTIETYAWNYGAGIYETYPQATWLKYLVFPDRPGALYQTYANGPTEDDYSLYLQYEGDKSLFAVFDSNPERRYTVYWNGPLNNVSASFRPPFLTGTYNLDVVVKTVDGTPVPGLTIQLDSTNSQVTVPSGSVSATAIKPSSPLVVDSGWSVVSSSVRLLSPSSRLVRLEMVVTRPMRVQGWIHDGDLGVPEVGVRFLDRFGHVILSEVTDEQGLFNLTFDRQVVYIQVRRPGYFPMVTRRSSPSVANSDILGVDIALERLPAPELTDLSLNRFGLFFPGILKSGTNGFDPVTAQDALTCIWRLMLEPRILTWEQPGFDDAYGPTVGQSIQAVDELEMGMLVDLRRFSRLSGETWGQELLVQLPDDLGYQSLISFLSGLLQGNLGQDSPFAIVINRGEAGVDSVEGGLRLWELPVGQLRPAVLGFTRFGAAFAAEYQVPEGMFPLEGIRMATWAARLTNLVSSAGDGPLGFKMVDVVPRGTHVPADNAETVITATEDGYLDYSFNSDMEVFDGTDMPRVGLLALGPRALGFSMEGRLAFVLEGLSRNPNLSANILAGVSYLKKLGWHLPAFLSRSGQAVEPANLDIKYLGGGAEGEVLRTGTAGTGLVPDLKMRTDINGYLTGELEFDMPVEGQRLPYLGQFISEVQGLGTQRSRLKLAFETRGETTTDWNSIYAEDSQQFPGQPARTHFLGGRETMRNHQYTWMSRGSYVGTAPWGKVSARADFQVGGPDGVSVVMNPAETWPSLAQVSGTAWMTGTISRTVAGVSRKKTLSLSGINTGWSMNGQPWFELLPLDLQVSLDSPLTTQPPEWVGLDGVLLDRMTPISRWSVLRGEGIWAYTTQDPTTGTTSIALAFPGSNSGGPVLELETGAVVLDLAMARLEDGRILLVWSQLALEDLGEANSSSLVYALGSEDGLEWTSNKKVGVKTGLAFELELVPQTGGALLAYVISGTQDSIRGAFFNGEIWKKEEIVHPTMDFDGFVVLTGDLEETGIGVVTVSGKALLYPYAEGTWGSVVVLAESGASALSGVYSPSNGLILALAKAAGPVSLLTRGEDNLFHEVGVLTDRKGISETDLLVIKGVQKEMLFATWVSRGADDRMWYGFVNSDFTIDEGETELSLPSPGRIDEVALFKPSSTKKSWTAGLMARTSLSGTDTLNKLFVTRGEGPWAPPDEPFQAVEDADVVEAYLPDTMPDTVTPEDEWTGFIRPDIVTWLDVDDEGPPPKKKGGCSAAGDSDPRGFLLLLGLLGLARFSALARRSLRAPVR